MPFVVRLKRDVVRLKVGDATIEYIRDKQLRGDLVIAIDAPKDVKITRIKDDQPPETKDVVSLSKDVVKGNTS